MRNCTVLASLLYIVTCGFTGTADGAILSGPIANPANGHSYYLLSQNTWIDSEAEAISLGGHLVTINDPAENAWVWSTFGGGTVASGGQGRTFWIGLNDAEVEGTYRWASGELLDTSPWLPGTPWAPIHPPYGPEGYEPNHFFDDEDYVFMRAKGDGWADVRGGLTEGIAMPDVGEASLPIHGIVEINSVPEPATFAIWGVLGSIGVCTALFRKRNRPGAPCVAGR
jgi:hypothetical protein